MPSDRDKEDEIAWNAALLARDMILKQLGELQGKFMASDLKAQFSSLKVKADARLLHLEEVMVQRRQLKLRMR